MTITHMLVAAVLATAACQDSKPTAPAPVASKPGAAPTEPAPEPAPAPTVQSGIDPAYAGDVERICNAVVMSGAHELPEGDRHIRVATWIAGALATEAGREFLVEIGPLTGNDKADRLEREAAAMGLADGCPLAGEWRE